jgi:CheY-like chemotaxis protein
VAMHVLIVDDNDSARAVLRATCRMLGAAPTTCASAAEAQATLPAQPFRLALIDYHMPGTDGVVLARWLRGAAPGLRLVATTADVTLRSDATMLADVFDKVLYKPLNMAAIAAEIAAASAASVPPTPLQAGLA